MSEANASAQAKPTSLLRWRGLMADAPRGTRMAAIGLLVIASCTMVATQTNYLVVGNTHLIAVLAPITVTALLYGPLAAGLVGAFAGTSEMLHARLLPLDAYEMYFGAATNSLFLFTLVGVVMGMLFALANRRTYKSDLQGLAALASTCIIGSLLFTLLFTISVNAINALLNLEVPHEILNDIMGNREIVSQVFADFLLMAGLSVIGGAAMRKRERMEGQNTLRGTFQGWLAVVIVAAYMVTVSFGYTVISSACLTNAEQQMQAHIDYLVGQLGERDKLVQAVTRRIPLSDAKVNELYDITVEDLARGLSLGRDGISAVAQDGTIISANIDAYVGSSFEDVVGSGLADGFDESLYEQARSTQWYMGNGKLGYLRASQVGYVRVSRAGKYQVMAAMSSSDVFAWRNWMMLGTSAIFMMLFAVVYFQASLLLENVVVRSIDETNQTLERITNGDLDQQVKVSDSVEFVSLSRGINATVSALKRAILAEGARIERDLTTAKSIQESALPRTFPPFPEIDRFDIYANMSAAREVGGDFYDFFLVDEHTLGFLIADVAGKGIPASLFMMAAKAELANYISTGMPLTEAVQTANWHLCQGNEADMFVTVWAATLDYRTGELTYVNAGHNPPLLRHDGAWQWLRYRGGLFLGSFDSAKYRSTTLVMVPGDQLLLYTDGVNEAFNAYEEKYGDQRLERFLASHNELHPHALVDALRMDLQAWSEGTEQSDDITILSLEYGVPPEASGTITVEATLDHLEEIYDMIHEELAQRRCPISIQNKLDVALEELYVNVCNYAYEDQEGPGLCRVDYIYNADPDVITIQLTDWGTPFDPLTREDPTKPSSIQEAKVGGLGIFMAKQLTDDISYLRDGDANVIAFKKSW